MIRFLLLLVTILACGLVAAGCGDDEDGESSDAPAKTESIPSDTTESVPSDTTESEGGDPGEETPPAVSEEATEQAVEACKQQVQSAGGQLSDDLKGDLEQLCEDAAEGDEEGARRASVELCERVVDETIPEGPAREQALAACEQAQAP